MEPTLNAVIEPLPGARGEPIDLDLVSPEDIVKVELPEPPPAPPEPAQEIAPATPPAPCKKTRAIPPTPVPVTRQKATCDPPPPVLSAPLLSVVSYMEVAQSLALAFAVGAFSAYLVTAAFSRYEVE